jgi:diaminohydroxyphosphoribosylaminopyrimidine deaminase/5-amino-6-(5-phosphoribosylamino)uracil reductase
VLVYAGRVIGEGWHHFYGGTHAEVNCIDSVQEHDRHLIPDSIMYVSLEPCAHQGNTPPCALRLVEEGIKKVVIANIDPFEKVGGRGIGILQEYGADVKVGVLDAEGLWVNRRFFCYHTTKRPYIILKWAQTPEGYMAPVDGGRLQISNPHSNKLVHKWRTEEGAILVGTNTAINDNPELTAREWTGKQPLRIVLDKNLKVLHTHKLLNEAAATWIINEQKETLQGNLHYIQMAFDETLLPHLLQRLYDARILSLIIEGGAKVLESFIGRDLWDEARVFTGSASLQQGIAAPKLQNGVPAFTTALDDDLLQVWTNKAATPYVQGMEL